MMRPLLALGLALMLPQFDLPRLLVINCQAADMHLAGQDAANSHLPDPGTAAFLAVLPADAVPHLGGDGLEQRIVRLDWHIRGASGGGFDLLVHSREPGW